MIKRVLFALFLIASPAAAQDSVFDSYDAMRAEMDGLLSERSIAELMLRFGGQDEMTQEQLSRLEGQVKSLYPSDFRNSAVMRRARHENGFAQELIAYWTGINYLYAYVFYHDTGSGVIAINFRFNSDFNKLNALF